MRQAIRCYVGVLLLFLCLCQGRALASSSTAPHDKDMEKHVLELLQKQTASIETLACSFTQKTDIPLFASPVISKGTLRFKAPDILAWEYDSPVAEGFVLTGDSGYRWQDTPERRVPFMTAKDPVASLLGRQVVSWIRFDQKWIASEYSIAVHSLEPLALTLTPKKTDVRAMVKALGIVFTPDGVAQSVTLLETTGGKTTIRFRDVILNKPLDPQEFW